MEIVDDQHDDFGLLREIGDDRVDHRVASQPEQGCPSGYGLFESMNS